MLNIGSIQVLHGANQYSRQSVLVCKLRFAPPLPAGLSWEVDKRTGQRCSDLLRDFCQVDFAPGFFDGNAAETVIQTVAMSLMSWTGAPAVDKSEWIVPTPGAVVMPAQPEPLARECLEAAIDILALAKGPSSLDSGDPVHGILSRLERAAKTHLLRIQPAALAEAARIRGIPWRRLSGTPEIFQLGEGSRQCRLDLSVSSGTSRLATDIARDKYSCNRLLARFGLPVSQQVIVTDADRAKEAAGRIGFPVVVKPRRGNMGNGVSVHLTTDEEVAAAFARARAVGREVIVETYLPGDDHRILVAGKRIIAAARRMPAHVVGDGNANIRELLETVNADPRRSKSYWTQLMTIEFDKESGRLLSMRGYTLDSVPERGEIVQLKSAANWTTGGTTIDVTDRIHPETAAMVLRATELIGLDIAGVDLLIPDIARSFREIGGGICEVNYRPGILVHISAEGANGRDVAGDLIDAIYRQPRQGRIPCLVVYAPSQSSGDELCAEIARKLGESWQLRPACHNGDGLILGDWRVSDGPTTPRGAFELAVRDPAIDAVVLAVDPTRLIHSGLGMTGPDVVVVPDWDAVTDPEIPRKLAERIFSRAGAFVMEETDAETCARALMEVTA